MSDRDKKVIFFAALFVLMASQVMAFTTAGAVKKIMYHIMYNHENFIDN